MYKTYVGPLVENETSVFSPYNKKDIFLIEKVQNYCTRKLVIRYNGFFY